jgi:uncharacterized protein (TIRG00374 family)
VRVRVPRPVLRLLMFGAAAAIVWFLVIPQLAHGHEALRVLGAEGAWWPAMAIALEAASLVAYAQLTRSVLPSESTPKLTTVLRIDLSTLALSHVVPAGSAAGISLRYRLFTRLGISGTDAAFGTATQSLGSAIVLNSLLWVAIVVAIPLHGMNPLYASAAITGGVFLSVLAALVCALTRGENVVARRLGVVLGKLPLVRPAAVERIVHAFAARLRQLSADRRLLLRAMGWAALNWLLDMAALWVFLAGLGHRVGIVGIMVCYGLANVVAALPLTPGGLGVVEAALSTLLVGFSVPAHTALLGVLCWRAVNFWLPIPVGGLAYLSLKRSMTKAAERITAEAANEPAVTRSRTPRPAAFRSSPESCSSPQSSYREPAEQTL